MVICYMWCDLMNCDEIVCPPKTYVVTSFLTDVNQLVLITCIRAYNSATFSLKEIYLICMEDGGGVVGVLPCLGMGREVLRRWPLFL